MDASTLTALLLALPALVLGGLAGAWLVSRSAKRRLDDAQALAASQAEAARAGPEEKARGLEAQLAELRSQQAHALETARELRQADGEKAVRIGELQTQLTDAARAQAENEARLKALVEETEKRFTAAFEVLAGRIEG